MDPLPPLVNSIRYRYTLRADALDIYSMSNLDNLDKKNMQFDLTNPGIGLNY